MVVQERFLIDLGQKRRKQEVFDWNDTRFYSSKIILMGQKQQLIKIPVNLSLHAMARKLRQSYIIITCKQQNRFYRVPFYFNLKFIQKI